MCLDGQRRIAKSITPMSVPLQTFEPEILLFIFKWIWPFYLPFFFVKYSEVTSCFFIQKIFTDQYICFIHILCSLLRYNQWLLSSDSVLTFICHCQASERAFIINGHSSFVRNNAFCILNYHHITCHMFFMKSIQVLRQPPRLFYKHTKEKILYGVSLIRTSLHS